MACKGSGVQIPSAPQRNRRSEGVRGSWKLPRTGNVARLSVAFRSLATSEGLADGAAAHRAVERKRRAVDGVGALPRRLAAQDRAGQQGRCAGRPRRASGPAGPVARPRTSPGSAGDLQRCDRRVVRGRLPELLGHQAIAARSDEVAEHTGQRPPPARHERPPRRRQAVGRSHLHRAPRGALRRNGDARLFDQHDRPQLELPQPGPATRTPPSHDQDESGRRRAPAGEACREAAQELHHRAGTAAARRRHPGRRSAGHVAHRPDVRTSARASWPDFAGASSTSTPSLRASASPSGPWRSTTATPARWSRRPRAAGVPSGFTRSSSPPCTATGRRCGCSVCTTRRASCSAAATARR